MEQCDFEKLMQLAKEQLGLDEKLAVLNHLDECEICRDAFYQIALERDARYLIRRPYKDRSIVPG